MKNTRRLIDYARPYYLHILLSIVAGVGCSVASVWVVDILKQIVDAALAGSMGEHWKLLVGKAAAAILLGLLTNYLVVAVTGFFGAGILRDMRRDALAHIMKTAPDFMEKNNFGDIIERLSSDIDSIAGYMQTYFKDCLYVPIIVVVFAGYLISLHPVLAASCLVPLAILVPFSIVLLKPVKLAQADYVKKLGLTNNHIQEAHDGVEIIKSYGLGRYMEQKYYKDLKETLDISNKTDLRQYHIEPISALVREAPTAIALCVGGHLAFGGGVTMGMLIAFINAIKKINEPLVYAYQLVIRSQMAMVAVRRVFDVMKLPIEEEQEGLAPDKVGNVVFCLEKVSFAYDIGKVGEKQCITVSQNVKKGEVTVLRNITLSIGKGTRTALVGKSGCGKSTVLKLLCRHYEVVEGTLYYYGHSCSQLFPGSMRKDIALISQDSMIFPMSVADNIRMGKPEASLEEIVKAARLAGCDEFIQNMSEGYDTLLEEKGANLSGGQRQRISIARAILKDAPIWLLDEPTSALDRRTEEHIHQIIAKLSEGRTVITVAHRLNTIMDYDNIAVMEKGKIVEMGNHEALMRLGGRYFAMYEEYKRAGGDVECRS